MVALAAAGIGLVAAGVGAYGASQQAAAAREGNAEARNASALQRRLAQQQQELATASTRNARGDVTRYVPGFGWVEELSPQSQAIQDASAANELARQREQPRGEMVRRRAFEGTLRDSGLAGEMLARRSLGQRTPEQVNSAAIRTGIAEAAAAPNELRRSIVTAALRQGTGGEAALAGLGRQTMSDRRSVIARADAETPRMFAGEDSSRLDPVLARYGDLSRRASVDPTAPFNASTLADSLTASRSRQQSVAPQGIGSAMNIRPAQITPVDDRLGLRIGSAGNALEGFAENKAVRGLFEGLFNRNQQQPASNVQRTPPDVNEGLY